MKKLCRKEEDMKKILVTGCNGQLGRAIRNEYANEDVTFVNTDVVEADGVTALDISDIDAVLSLVRETKPDVIINCAAHTNVDACEKEWDLAYKINAIGPRNLSIAANKVSGIRCGHCSNVEQAHLTKEHNHANIIAISYKQDLNEIAEMIKEFIETEPSTEERHVRRVNKISNYEVK